MDDSLKTRWNISPRDGPQSLNSQKMARFSHPSQLVQRLIPRISYPKTKYGAGLYSCIGKQLALMELRYVVAQIVHRFDVSFAPGQKEEAFIEGKRDAFTLACAPLSLVFSGRK
jgi:cytochrome P450